MLKTRIGYIICFSIILSLFVYSKSINTKSMELSSRNRIVIKVNMNEFKNWKNV